MATKYLRASAPSSPTPTGNDWDTAYVTMSQAHTGLSRGDTLYVADGSYGSVNLTKAASGTTTITIKKAIETDHGAASGWDITYGDGQATFSDVTFSSPYWIWDGQTGGGPGSWISNFGFKVQGVGSSGSIFDLQSNHIKASHTDVQGSGAGGSAGQDGQWLDENGIDCWVSYCYFHDCGGCLLKSNRSPQRILWEYCAFGVFGDNLGTHVEITSLHDDFSGPGCRDLTFRYCLFTHSQSTGGIMTENIAGPVIYGCVFAPLYGNTLGGGNGVVGTWDGGDIGLTNALIYNNTFINVQTNIVGILNADDTGEFKNNLIYNTTGAAQIYLDRLTHTHNHYVDTNAVTETNKTTGTGNPFVDWPNEDFGLTANTTAGTNLGAGTGNLPSGFGLAHTWNVDMFGTTRSTWTRGAIEFGSGGGGSVPAAPTNLRFV